MTRSPFVVPLACLLCAPVIRTGAQSMAPRSSPHRAERQVVPGGVGANRLSLDAWALTRGRPFQLRVLQATDGGQPLTIAEAGLTDLRLYDLAGREVPYLLAPPALPSAQWTTGQILPLLPTKTTSGFELALDQATRVDRLRIDGLPTPFLKRATLEGSGDRERWTLLTDRATVFDLPDQRLKQLEIPFAAGDFRYLRVTWDDRNSGRVPDPTAAAVRLPAAGPAPESLRVPLVVDRRPSEPGRSRYRLTLPAAHLPIVAIDVAATDPNILRSARIIESRLTGDRLGPRELGSATLTRASRGDAIADQLTVSVAAPSGTHVDLTIDDGSNAPLDLTGVVAVLAPVPWVYFESADGQPMVARFGGASPGPPSYDLEAVRPTLANVSMSMAAWGDAAATPPPATETTSVPTAFVGGRIDVTRYRIARPIPAGPAGLTALSLDAAALAHSRLADLRIVDDEGRQRAYLLESRDEPLAAPLGAPVAGQPPAWLQRDSQSRSERRTAYPLRLPYEGLPASRLVLTTSTRVFTRPVAVYVERQPVTTKSRTAAVVASATWSHSDPGIRAPQLTLDLPPMSGRELALVVDEGDNAPLALDSATVLLPGYAIRFFRSDGAPLTLYYGDDSATAPRYDLALLRPYLLDAPATEVAPGPERQQAAAAGTPASLPTWAFWGVLVAAVVVLLALIARLLRLEGSPAA